MILSGLLLIDKPPKKTSYDVVRWVRKQLPKGTKVGHLGTLDPFASGLLPLLIGPATRLSDIFLHGSKQYTFTVTLGSQTDTLDSDGLVVAEAPIPPLWHNQLPHVIPLFLGDLFQVPPAYSALKYQGRPLYEYMRTQGKLPFDIQEKGRMVSIHALTVLSTTETTLTAQVVCGGGTYVRCLARDIALALGTVGHCTALRRDAVGEWSVQNALSFERLLDGSEDWQPALIRSDRILAYMPQIPIPDSFFEKLAHGQEIVINSTQSPLEASGRACVLCQRPEEDEPVAAFVCVIASVVNGGLRLAPKIRLF